METTTKFEKVKKKYALNNSYFKNRNHNMPSNPVEVMEYYKEHKELPFDMGKDETNWLYECFIEYQKRTGVYNSQFFTPPITANRIAELAKKYFNVGSSVLDACCGFGQLSKPLDSAGFEVSGFDIDFNMKYLYHNNTYGLNCDVKNLVEHDEFSEFIVSNPPYEIPILTKFLENLHDYWFDIEGTAILILPKFFIDKERPKAIKQIVSKFNILHREDMQEDFARTKIRAEIVVLKKELQL